MTGASSTGQFVALAGYFSLAFGLMYGLAIAKRHLDGGIPSRHIPARVTLVAAIAVAGMAILDQASNPLFAGIEIAAFSSLLWELVTLARRAPEGAKALGVSAVLIIFGTLCLRVFNYVR